MHRDADDTYLVIPLRPEHLEELFGDEPVPSDDMVGITLLRPDGLPVMCGGTMRAQWGEEMWIRVSESVSGPEKRIIAKLALDYVGVVLSQSGKAYAHIMRSDKQHVRWLQWLGFVREKSFTSSGGIVDRYIAETGDGQWE